MTERNRKRVERALQSGQRVTPSDPNPWQGTPAAGSLWTVQQLRTLARVSRDPATVKRCEVPVQVQNRANWTMPPETRRILCPQLAATRDGSRAKIIAPAGDIVWVNAK